MAAKSLEGQMLGKYRVLEPLGAGGMARVYRAYHPQLDRYVAIKVLRSDLVEEQEFLARFRREAQSVANLRHAHIIQVYDFDVQDDVYYMVMELLEGDSLKARLNGYHVRGETMPVGEMVRVMLDVLDALAYAHSEGMIHRDIKPANIMLTGRGQAVLTDFGIAQIVGGTHYTASGALMGTLNYMAPEQGLQKGDARSDLYSMGIVLYEMFTGRPPFDADTPLAILLKHLNDPLPLPRTVNPDIPEAYERVLLKALCKAPEDRYQNAGEMAQALRAAVAEAGTDLPDRLSLPSAVRAAGAPTEPVAVYSGTARDDLSEAPFAADDTDTTLDAKLATERAKLATGVTRPAAMAAGEETPPDSGHSIVRAAIGGISIWVGWNLLALAFSGILNSYRLFSVGWPLELLLVALFFSLLMEAMGLIWMLIPAGLFTLLGVILGFFQFTHAWSRWQLWALLPLFWGGVIAYTVMVGTRYDAQTPRWAQRLAQWLAIGLGAVITFASYLIALGLIH